MVTSVADACCRRETRGDQWIFSSIDRGAGNRTLVPHRIQSGFDLPREVFIEVVFDPVSRFIEMIGSQAESFSGESSPQTPLLQ